MQKKRQKPLQFLQKGCVPKKNLRSQAKGFLTLFFISISMLFISTGIITTHRKYVEKDITKKFTHLYERDQNLLQRKISLDTPSSIQEKMDVFRKEIHEEKSFFPFIPTIPSATEVLEWLHAHPFFSNKVEKIQYKLISFPTLQKMYTPYKAQVILQFSQEISPDEMQKTLHKNSFIDSPSWEKNTLTFYLKK